MQAVPPVIEAYIDGLKTHDLSRIADTVSPDLAFITPVVTLDKQQFLAMLRALYHAFPNWHYEHDPPQVTGDTIAIRWRQGGSHTGELSLPGFEPIPATGKTVKIPEQHFYYRVRDGKIIQIKPDPIPGGAPGGILKQIGVSAAPL